MARGGPHPSGEGVKDVNPSLVQRGPQVAQREPQTGLLRTGEGESRPAVELGRMGHGCLVRVPRGPGPRSWDPREEGVTGLMEQGWEKQ